MTDLRDAWEETSFELEKLQANPVCVQQEMQDLKHRKLRPAWKVTFDPDAVQLRSIGKCTCTTTPVKCRRHIFSAFFTATATETRPHICLSADKDAQHLSSPPRVAVVREEGINGDREMIASLYMAGFEVFDVMITDILTGEGECEQATETANISFEYKRRHNGNRSSSDLSRRSFLLSRRSARIRVCS